SNFSCVLQHKEDIDMNKKATLILLLSLLALVALVAPAAGAQDAVPAAPVVPAEPVAPAEPVYPPGWNMVQNPGFEDGANNPDAWSKYALEAGANFKWDDTVAHTGGRSVKIAPDSVNDARWFQTVGVMENTDYVLSGWIKTRNVAASIQSVNAGANLSVETNLPGT